MDPWLALASGALGSLVTFIVAWFALPKLKAEARKINVETDSLIVTRLYAEIERLDRELADVRDKFTTLEREASSKEDALERENKRLRGQVRRLTMRVTGLEAVLKIVPQTTPEMQAAIDELNKIDRGRG